MQEQMIEDDVKLEEVKAWAKQIEVDLEKYDQPLGHYNNAWKNSKQLSK